MQIQKFGNTAWKQPRLVKIEQGKDSRVAVAPGVAKQQSQKIKPRRETRRGKGPQIQSRSRK